jgi:hypothetical protein
MDGKIAGEKWYSAREAAAHLGVTELTVTGYCRQNKLAQVKKMGPNGRWHVRGSAILKKLKEWGKSE